MISYEVKEFKRFHKNAKDFIKRFHKKSKIDKNSKISSEINQNSKYFHNSCNRASEKCEEFHINSKIQPRQEARFYEIRRFVS